MRTLHSRGDWKPISRIEGLRRYAFIGDSMTFGHGVAPDETLPACAERQMNGACLEDCVEAVNFGISGYNLWNSWLDFTNAPQVYDGVVLTLCGNDSEIFCRTYQTALTRPDPSMWEASHFSGHSVARCFEEMEIFSRHKNVPIAVCFYYLWDDEGRRRNRDLLAELCAAHSFPFIDSMVAIRKRDFSNEALVVSECDPHPSAIVHEAVGRHLVRTLEQSGWFGAGKASSIEKMAECILAAARSMNLNDHYPLDAVHLWSIRTLNTKLHQARRRQALSTELEDFTAASNILSDLVAIHQSWHLDQRTRSFLDELSAINQILFWCLTVSEEQRLKIDELAFVLRSVDWPGFSSLLKEIPDGLRGSTQGEPPASEGLFEKYLTDLDGTRDALLALTSLRAGARTLITTDYGGFRQSNLDRLLHLVERVRNECHMVKEASTRLDDSIEKAAPSLQQEDAEIVCNLRNTAIKKAHQSFSPIHQWSTKAQKICDPEYARYTIIEVSVRSPGLEGKRIKKSISVFAEYHAPNRLPLQDNGNFFGDGSTKFIKLYLPLLYTGRIFLKIHRAGAPIDFELINVEVYNLSHQRRQIPATEFSPQPLQWLASPTIYLY
jgi:hypothetical protein